MIIERNKSEPTIEKNDPIAAPIAPETVTVNPVDENYPLGDDDITLVPDEEDV